MNKKAILIGGVVLVVLIAAVLVASRGSKQKQTGSPIPPVDKSQTGGTTPSPSGQPSEQPPGSGGNAAAAPAINDAQSLINDLGGMNSSANQFNENQAL